MTRKKPLQIKVEGSLPELLGVQEIQDLPPEEIRGVIEELAGEEPQLWLPQVIKAELQAETKRPGINRQRERALKILRRTRQSRRQQLKIL